MVSTPVAIGPFTGGLNNYSDPAAVGDNECTRIENFDVDLDGTLVSRPNIYEHRAFTGGMIMLGMYRDPANGEIYIIFYTDTSTRYYNVDTGTVATIIGHPCRDMVIYDDKVWLITVSAATGTGGSWDPTAGWTSAPDMAHGVTAAVYKERMFIGEQSGRVRFSAPANFTSWTSTDFFDVTSGDGDDLVRLFIFNNQIVIFKRESTYIFAYDSSPSRGSVQIVSSSVGVDNVQCMVEQDGIIYVFHNQIVYAINNWKWERLNVKVIFDGNPDAMPVNFIRRYTLSIIEDRLVLRHNRVLFIYGLKTRVWSKWTTTHRPDYFLPYPEKKADGSSIHYASGHNKDVEGILYAIEDGPVTSVSDESFTVRVDSKIYDYSVPYAFKRLFWWGIDVNAKAPLSVVAIPFVHDSPAINIVDAMEESFPTGARIFIKFIKALRFRKIQFRVDSTLDGTDNTVPLRIYSMVANISSRQLVPNKIN